MLNKLYDISGTSGPDRLFGTRLDDEIRGGAGGDTLFGLGGNDILRGGYGNDALFGGDGNDRLHGDQGNDLLTGGAGHDLFVFIPLGGSDHVTDYTDGEDRLDFRDFDVASVDDLLTHAAQNGTDVVFSFDAGETVTLHNVQLSSLGGTDFLI